MVRLFKSRHDRHSRDLDSKAKEAEREKKEPSPSPPPEYSQQPSHFDREDIIDPPDLTAGFSNLSFDRIVNTSFPISVDCIAHLKVLECFYKLRQTVGSTDGLFGISNSAVLGSGTVADDKTAELLAKLAEKKWSIFLARAVDRYEAWLIGAMPDSRMLTLRHLEGEGARGTLCEPSAAAPPLKLDAANMPPVDVLMVWHAHMLNPRAYLEDCLRYGRMQLWHTPMPWEAASACINSETFAYEVDPAAADLFTGITDMSWDNLASDGLKKVNCPGCKSEVAVPWTNCSHLSLPGFEGMIQRSPADTIDQMLSQGSGYCDKDFLATCTACKSSLNHDTLKAGKFCRDVEQLIAEDVPMAGTVLGMRGIPFKFGQHVDAQSQESTRPPNSFLYSGLGQEILDRPLALGLSSAESMDAIRDMMEPKIKDVTYVRKVRGTHARTFTRTERVSIRKMMSRYWENSSPFALDLVGAVIRQSTFIEKMHHIDWLHSPALPSTMKRLLQKYSRFIAIMAAHRFNMAVPTLDVDLAWHTHQLHPHAYMTYTVDNVKQFVDHDDKVAEVQLNDAFAWTAKTYQKLYNEPYSECTCWYCEAVRESNTSRTSSLFNRGPAAPPAHPTPQDPAKSVHISTHNAVRPTDAPGSTYSIASKRQAAELEKHYQKACARARKKGQPEPKRNDYYYSDAWGYPVWIPAYSPYVGYMPYAVGYYPATPGCMALGAGAVGNCCSGTCGGGVAAGACGSSGGGCAGGSSVGGCGGGGGGGGCGGGGGGGGGGGCGGGGGGGGGGCGGGGC